MSTKNKPGQFDCYAKLRPDEPYFVLRASDPVAPYLVHAWRMLRADDYTNAVNFIEQAYRALPDEKILPTLSEKSKESYTVAMEMLAWYDAKVADDE